MSCVGQWSQTSIPQLNMLADVYYLEIVYGIQIPGFPWKLENLATRSLWSLMATSGWSWGTSQTEHPLQFITAPPLPGQVSPLRNLWALLACEPVTSLGKLWIPHLPLKILLPHPFLVSPPSSLHLSALHSILSETVVIFFNFKELKGTQVWQN